MRKDEQGQIVRAMTIAGSDSGGGAGIEADLKTFAAFGVYGTAAVTAVTAQNTVGVHGVLPVSSDFVSLQIQSVLDDIGTHALKTGMLGNANVIRAVAEVLASYRLPKLVIDPVMVAKGGESLLEPTAVETLKEVLLPLAEVITPNLSEAEILCGYRLHSLAECEQAAVHLASYGARIVVIKGGHVNWLEGIDYAVDLIYDGRHFTQFRSPRIISNKTHGTGCTFSAAVTACLAQGMKPLDAIATAKMFIFDAISAAAKWNVGKGHGPTDHSVVVQFTEGMTAGGSYALQQHEWAEV